MDDHSFDELTRNLGSGLNRRSALSAALSGLVAAAGVTALSAEAKKGKAEGKKGKAEGKKDKHKAKSQGKKGKAEAKQGKAEAKQGKGKNGIGSETCAAYGQTCHDANDCCDRDKGVVCQNPQGGDPHGDKTCNCPGLNDGGVKPNFNTDPNCCGRCGNKCKGGDTCDAGE
jgi:hypothetical protein